MSTYVKKVVANGKRERERERESDDDESTRQQMQQAMVDIITEQYNPNQLLATRMADQPSGVSFILIIFWPVFASHLLKLHPGKHG